MDVIRNEDPKRKRNRRLVRWSMVVVVLSVAAVGLARLDRAAPVANGEQLWIDVVKRGTFAMQVRGAGVLAAEDVRWIAAATEGRVERVLIHPGTAVTPDAVLLEISNPELQQSALEAELQLRAAEAELRNRRNAVEAALLTQEAATAAAHADLDEAQIRATADLELAASGLVSPIAVKLSKRREQQLAVRVGVEEKRLELARNGRDADVATVRARVDQLRALLALRRQQIAALRVTAGMTGVLQEVAVQSGQRVAPGAQLARVAAPLPLKAVIQVSEVQASQVTVGQSVQVDTRHGVVSGRVSRIDPAAKDGSVTVDVALPRTLPAGVRPDSSVDAIVDVDRVPGALFVGRPVQSEPNGTMMLFRLAPDGRSAVRTRVRTGRVSWNAVEVLSGLSAGDRVILSDTAAFDQADRITITNR